MFFYNGSDSEVSGAIPEATDPYFSDVSLLLKMDTDFNDSSTYGHSVSVNGNAAITSTESKYGGASGYFDGNGDYLQIAHDTSLQLGSATNFTVEAWVYHTGDYSAWRPFISKRINGGTAEWQFFLHLNSGVLSFYNGTIHSFGTTVPANQWVHLAFVGQNGNTITAYVDGVAVGSISTWAVTGTEPLLIGQVLNSSPERWLGYIDDVRITKGVARYTANFTPPDSFPTS